MEFTTLVCMFSLAAVSTLHQVKSQPMWPLRKNLALLWGTGFRLLVLYVVSKSHRETERTMTHSGLVAQNLERPSVGDLAPGCLIVLKTYYLSLSQPGPKGAVGFKIGQDWSRLHSSGVFHHVYHQPLDDRQGLPSLQDAALNK
jgi:hypothetical protein